MWLLLAQTMPVPPTPQETAEGISKYGLHWVIGVLCTVVVALFGYVLWNHHARMADRDAKDKRLDGLYERHQAKLDALARDLMATVDRYRESHFALVRAIEEALPKRGGKVPKLPREPSSQVHPPPSEEPS